MGSTGLRSIAAHQPTALFVELLYDRPPALDAQALLAEVQRTLPGTTLMSPGPPSLTLAHEQFMGTYADGKRAPILTVVLTSDASPEPPQPRTYDTSQTWNWPEAQGVLDNCRTSLAIAEIMGQVHEPKDRVAAFRSTVLAAVAHTVPLATHWPASQHFLPPDGLQEYVLSGAVNVRLFRIEDDPGVMVMDTLGLHVLGLPDLQCHFRSLDASAMARTLYNTAAYIFEHGDVIEDGNTVAGVEGDEHWRCQHEDALVAPERLVVDIDPGDPYAAGGRRR